MEKLTINSDKIGSFVVQIHGLTLGLAQAYLVVGDEGMILIDAGSLGQEGRVLRLMRRLGRDDLRLIYLTHAHLDHYGSAAALHRLTGARVAIHALDGEALAQGRTELGVVRGWRGRAVRRLLPLFSRLLPMHPLQADAPVQDGQDLSEYGLPARVLHTPGHTPGSSCLLLEGGHAFVGDLLSTTGGPHVQRYFAADWSQLPGSLARLQANRPQWIYPGHGRRPMPGSVLQELSYAAG